MLGKQNQQTSFLDIESWLSSPLINPDSIYGLMSSWGNRLIQDSDFAELYSETGRPSVSPALLSKVLLLMYNDNVSDREAEERAKYDLRWKAALRLPMNESGFDYTALCRFRARLLVNKKEKLVFQRFVNLAKEVGIIKGNDLQIVDSTHVLGAGAVKDTFSLIKGAIRKLLSVSHKNNGKAKEILEKTILALDYTQKGKEEIDWNNPEAREELLNKLVKDSLTVLDALKDVELSRQEQTAKELLTVVTAQDVVEKEDGQVALKQGVAKDRVISVEDPQMRHGHKTSQGKFNGHKAQILMDENSEVITNVAVSPGNEADGDSLANLLEDCTVKPGTLMGDTAYGTLKARDTMLENGITPLAPLPMGGKKQNRFSKYDFTIDFEKQSCQCPAGQITFKTRMKDSQIIAFCFSAKICNHCEFRDNCTKHGQGRTVPLHEEEQRRREIIAENSTAEFHQTYRKRAKIERKNAHLMQHGLRKSRYIGRTKTLLQLAFTSAAVNIKRIFKLAKGKVCLFCKLQGVFQGC